MHRVLLLSAFLWAALSTGASAQTALTVQLGAAVAVDGVSSHAQLGMFGRIVVDLGRIDIGLDVHGGGPDTVTSPRVDYHVARGALRASLMYEVLDDPEWCIPIGIALGASGWFRLSTVKDPTLAPTPGEVTGAFTVGPEALVQWYPSALGGNAGLALGVGADILVPVTRFVIDDGGEPTELATLWPIAPHAWLAITVRTN